MNVPQSTADAFCENLQQSPNPPPLIFDYTSLRTAGTFITNSSSRGNITAFPHGVLNLFRNRRRRTHTLHHPYTSRSKSAYGPCRLLRPFCFPCCLFYRVAFAFLLLLGYPNAQNLCYVCRLHTGVRLGGGGLYVVHGSRCSETMRWWMVVVFILPLPPFFFSGADDLVTRVSNGTKGRRRVDYVLSKNFLFAHVESCCVLEFSCHTVGMCILGSLVACVLLIFGSIYMM